MQRKVLAISLQGEEKNGSDPKKRLANYSITSSTLTSLMKSLTHIGDSSRRLPFISIS